MGERFFPLIPLRGLVAFPQSALHFDAGRDLSVAALEEAIDGDQLCILACQRDIRQDEVEIEDIYEIGTLARISQLIRLPGDSVRVIAEGKKRVRILQESEDRGAHFRVEVEILPDINEPDEEMSEAWNRELISAFERFSRLSSKNNGELVLSLFAESRVGSLCDIIAGNMLPKHTDKQELLETLDVQRRAERLLEMLQRESSIRKLENNIHQKVRKSIDKGQREYFLREQMRVIRDELGDGDNPESERDELTKQLQELNLPQELHQKIEKEIKRYASLPPGSHETPMLRNWLDWALGLPWRKTTEDNFNLKHVREILDADHYGLNDVKDRVVEQLAVCQLRGSVQGSILCLAGPPGVGKTSVASSIARATGRNFVRMSLGGVHDESEIRGHRRTYIGAMPGRVINAMKQAGSMNPVILLDEIDKVGSSYQGDPTAALLEVLDSAQNSTFRDHYLEMPFDLSRVLFITTANTLPNIPAPLRDRMEIVELSSYTEEEKIQIAKRHLLPKQLKEHGLQRTSLRMNEPTIRDIVLGYTREAGVRTLERQIARICRKTAAKVVAGETERVTVSVKKLEEMLGPARFRRDAAQHVGEVGVVTGLAWTSMGGETLTIEVTPLEGTGRLELTGQLGDVMRESAQAAYTYTRANAAAWGIDPLFYRKKDLHIHIPEGAIPKDGPSAGISMATAMISALSGIPVRGDVAMTGEITLHGRVLPIGGLKEKSIAARREGISDIIVPEKNRADVRTEVPEAVRENCHFVYARELKDVLRVALAKRPKPYVANDREESAAQGKKQSVLIPESKSEGQIGVL